MSNSRFSVILLQSTSHAVRGESLLVRAGVDCRLIPVPRTLSSDCGVCIRVAPEDLERARLVLEGAHISIEGLHTLP